MRYGMVKETLLLFAKYLGNFLTKIQNQQLVSSMMLNFLIEPCISLIKNLPHKLLCVDFCQVLLTLVEIFIMLPRLKSRTRHIYVLLLYQKYAKTCFSSTSKCFAPTLGEDKNMFARFYQNKCSKFLIIFLSKICYKERHGLC